METNPKGTKAMSKIEYAEQLRQIEEDEKAVENAQAELRRIRQSIRQAKRLRRAELPKLQKAADRTR